MTLTEMHDHYCRDGKYCPESACAVLQALEGMREHCAATVQRMPKTLFAPLDEGVSMGLCGIIANEIRKGT